MPRFNCNGWASITVSENMPTTARVRLTHAFAHLAVFSQRASGVGIGATNPLKPQLMPADLVALEPAENGDLPASALGGAGDNQATVQSLIAPSGRKRGRKRKRNDSDAAPGSFEPSPPSDPVQTQYPSHDGSYSAPSPSMSNSTARRDASTIVVDTIGSDHNSASETPNAENYTLDQSGISWPPSHHHQISRFPPNHYPSTQQHVLPSPAPLLPQDHDNLHMQARVLFPTEYLHELRRTVDVAFAEAERPGGLTIDEARAFELAFAPIVQLARDFEGRQDSSIHPSLRSGPVA